VWPAMFCLSIASALLPFVPFEVAGLALAEAAPSGPVSAVVLGILAGAGATVGKVVWYEVARRGVDSRWVQKKMGKEKVRAGYERWIARVEGRPVYAGAVMFLSSSVGLPPLLVMAAVAGVVKMPMWVFLPTVFVGRCVRFVLLFLGADAFLPDFLH
jgi:membrane protein YqaA with SNARE-associated domain